MRKILVIIIVILPLSIYSQNISGELGWGKINSESSNSLFSSIVYEQSVNDKFGIITDPFLIYNFDYRSSVGNPVLFGITGGMYFNVLSINNNLIQIKGTIGGAYFNVDKIFRFTSKFSLSYDYFLTDNQAIGISGGMGVGKFNMEYLGIHYLFNFKTIQKEKEDNHLKKSYFSLILKPENITSFSIDYTTFSFNILGDWIFSDVFAFGMGIGVGYTTWGLEPFFNSYEFPIFINSMLFLGKGERLRPYLVMQPGIALNTKINNPIDYYYDFGGGVAFKCKNNSLSIESRIRSGFNEELEFQDNSFTVSLFYSFTFRKQRN